ncbi:MAG TPA: DUF1552 domain-containing protein [Steroidobacteraceae bacterium]|nr:DUF1552 domain-containing protein [Steroidobacteraceae bacterium]
MFITKKHLSRRTVLRGFGATIALPLLDAMIPAGTALASTAAAPAPRMGFVYFPHGAIMNRWMPTATGTSFDLPQILKPLEPYKSQLTVVSGLRNKAGESPSPHAIIAGTWLTCVPPPVSQAPHGGTSADQVAAQHIGQDTPLPSLELAGEGGGGACDPAFGCSYSGTVAFRTPTQPLPMENDPRKVFYRLFGQGDTANERNAIMDETGSILDLVTASAADLQKDLGPADKRMVNDYLDSVREVERRTQKMKAKLSAGIKLPDAPAGVPEDFGKMLDTMFEMIALAWQANMTRVASFMIAKEVSMRTYPQIQVTDAFHPLSHHQNDATKLDKLAKIQTWHTEAFARFAKRLASTQDGDGTLLDHSIILYGSNMSNSDLHNNDPLPSAVLGRGYGKLKGGQHLHYPQDTPHANLLVTLLNRAGVQVESLGISTGQLSEV